MTKDNSLARARVIGPTEEGGGACGGGTGGACGGGAGGACGGDDGCTGEVAAGVDVLMS